MKILLINHYAGSVYHGMEFRPYYMSREWVRMGHEVTVVAASFSHLRQKNIEMDVPVKEEIIDGIRYVWFKTPAYSGNGMGRIKNMLAFLSKLYRYEGVLTENFVPDAVVASSTYPLDSYPANRMAKKYGAKFVFELHDLWPMSPMVLGNMSQWHPFIMAMQRAEDYWCRNADLVVSLLPDAYKHLVTRGMSIDKYVVIPNGVSPDEWEETGTAMPEEHYKTIKHLRDTGKFIVGYVGGHAISNGLDFLLDVADILLQEDRIHFLLIGKGTEKERLKLKAERMGLKNVTFLNPVPKMAVPDLLGNMDVLVFGFVETPLAQYGASENKLFDYMMAARPVIRCSDVSNDLITYAGSGFTLKPNDKHGMADKIFEMSNADAETLKKMGRNGRDYVLKNYSYHALAKNFIRILPSQIKEMTQCL